MSRAILLTSLSFVALAADGSRALAASVINGGGSTQAGPDWSVEQSIFNAGQTTGPTFGTYWESGSGTGQLAFIADDLTCDINKVTGANGGKCSGPAGGANTVHYGASDAPLTTSQTSSWATSTVGQSLSGNLIQIPTQGTSVGVVINDTNIIKNGQAVFSDNDLCGIFSGLLTDFSQITDSATAPAAGAFKVAYRLDSSASTFLLTNHLNAVCNTGNTLPGVTFLPTTTFASLFGTPITNQIPGAVGQNLSSGIANYLSGLVSGAVPQAVGYLSPDWTSIASKTAGTTLSNGQNSTLLVAGVTSGSAVAQLPTVKAITVGELHVLQGTNINPPATQAAAANPLNWDPIIQTVSAGYPIIGYSTFDLSQCYADRTIAPALVKFLKDHYKVAAYTTTQTNAGFVPLSKSGATKYLAAVTGVFLTNKKLYNLNIGNTKVCAGFTGR